MKVIKRSTGKVLKENKSNAIDEMIELTKKNENIVLGKPTEQINYNYKKLDESKLNKTSLSYFSYNPKKSNHFIFDGNCFENI